MTTAWIERVRRRLKRWVDSGLGRRWVVAVSGGSDSVGLLRVLHTLSPDLGLDLSVAHLNHGVRGEADARQARYAWLADVAGRRGAAVVAVGHTRDDQAETVLHRIVRGTGPRGLAGIPWRRPLAAGVSLVRPLRDVGRDDLRACLAALGQPFRDDATNADRARTRARIRHELLPRLAAEYNPRVAEALVRLGALAGAAERAHRHRVQEQLASALREASAERIGFDRARLAALGALERADVVRLAWRRAGWPERGMRAAHWRTIARLARPGSGRATVAGGVQAVADAARLVLLRRAPIAADVRGSLPLPLPLPGDAAWNGGQIVATVDPDAPRDETLDRDALAPPLVVRAPAHGDRFDPLGMDGRTKPLNDFFRARRVRPADRETTPIVCDQQGIVWVVGHRIAHRVRVRKESKSTVGLSWNASDIDRARATT